MEEVRVSSAVPEVDSVIVKKIQDNFEKMVERDKKNLPQPEITIQTVIKSE